MYSLILARGIEKNGNGRLNTIDVSTLPLLELYNRYDIVELELSNSFIPGTHYLDINDLPLRYRIYNNPVVHMLNANGNTVLPTTTTRKVVSYEHVRFYDTMSYDFKLAQNGASSNNLRVTKHDANYPNLRDYCLFTVNGLIHRKTSTSTAIVITNGLRTANESADLQVGILDFQHVGKLESISITSDMLTKTSPDKPYKEEVILKLPQPIGNKTPMVVIGGYLHTLADIVDIVNDDILRIDMTRMNIPRRLLNFISTVGPSQLGFSTAVNSAKRYPMSLLTSDATLSRVFTSNQSFVVLVDTPNVIVSKTPLRSTLMAGVYLSDVDITAPVVYGDGEFAEYVKSHEAGQVVLQLRHRPHVNYLYETTVVDDTTVVTPHVVPYKKWDYRRAHYLNLEKRTITME